MFSKILFILAFLIFTSSFIVYFIKIHYFLVVKKMKKGEPFRGFIREFYSFDNPFGEFHHLPFPLEKTNNNKIDEYIEKHNTALFTSLFLLLFGIVLFLMCPDKVTFE